MRATVGVVVATFASYLLWLGWHRPKDVDPVTGEETGPHEPWQVIGLVLTLAVVVAVAAVLAPPFETARAATAGLVVVFAADSATAPLPAADANLWPIGAMLLAAAALPGLFAVARTSSTLVGLLRHRGRRPSAV